MADQAVVAALRQGAEAWNAWRGAGEPAMVDLVRADLGRCDLRRADLSGVNLAGAMLDGARLMGADLARANLAGCSLRQANLGEARLDGATAVSADFTESDLRWARFEGANLTKARFYGADLTGTSLARAQMFRADLRWANLAEAVITDTNLSDADLYHADLRAARLCGVDLTGARLDLATLAEGTLIGCRVYGVSAWDVKLEGTEQADLVITPAGEPEILLDDLDAAQFVNLLLHSASLRHHVRAIETRMVLVIADRGSERAGRAKRLRHAVAAAGWRPLFYDPATAEPEAAGRMCAALLRICPVAVAELTVVAPFAKSLLDAVAQQDRRLIPLLPAADDDPSRLVEVAGRESLLLLAVDDTSLDRITRMLARL